jgi:hypothetical protein
MEPRGSLSCSHEPTTGPYLQRDESVQTLIFYLRFILILSHHFYGCETCSPTLMEQHRLSVFENRVLERLYGPKMKWQETGEDGIIRNFATCTLQ